MPSEAVLKKAEQYLAAGHVSVVAEDAVSGEYDVQGSDAEPYVVRFLRGVWVCDCPARVTCAHLLAAQTLRGSTDSPPSLDHIFSPPNPDLDALFEVD